MPLDDPYTYEPKEYANPGMPDGKVPPKPPMHPTAQKWEDVYNNQFDDLDFDTQVKYRNNFFARYLVPELESSGKSRGDIDKTYKKFLDKYPVTYKSSEVLGPKGAVGTGETALHMITGMIPLASGTATGLFTSEKDEPILDVIKKPDGTYDLTGSIPREVAKHSGVVTYEPRTEAGKKMVNSIGNLFTDWSEGVVDKWMVDPIDSPVGKVTAKVVGESIPMLAPFTPKVVRGTAKSYRSFQAVKTRKALLKDIDSLKAEINGMPEGKARQAKVIELDKMEGKASTAPFEWEDVNTMHERASARLAHQAAGSPDIFGEVLPEGMKTWHRFGFLKEVANKIPRIRPFYEQGKKAVKIQDSLRYRWNNMVKKSNDYLNLSGLGLKEGGKLRGTVAWKADMLGRELTRNEVLEMGELKHLKPREKWGVYRSYNALNNVMKNALKEINTHRKSVGMEPMAGLEGYMPHFFKDWVILQKKQRGEVGWMKDNVLDVMGQASYKTPREAISKLRGYLEQNKGLTMADFEIHGRSFEFPKSESSAAVVRDGQYFKLKSEIEKTGKMDVIEYLEKIDPGAGEILIGSEFLAKERGMPFEVDPNLKPSGGEGRYGQPYPGKSRRGTEGPEIVADDIVRDLIHQAQQGNMAALEKVIKMKARNRQIGNLRHRAGYKGYETDLGYSVPRYINQVSRYIAMDKFKRWSEGAYQRQYSRRLDEIPVDTKAWATEEVPAGRYGGEKHPEGVMPYKPDALVKGGTVKVTRRTGEPIAAREADFVRQYVDNLLGKPGALEASATLGLKRTLNKIGLGDTFNLGDRPLMRMASAEANTMMAFKLGLWNTSSALVNMSQLTMANGYLGPKWLTVGLKDSVRVLSRQGADYLRTRKSIASSGIMAHKGKPFTTEVKTPQGLEKRNLMELVEELEVPIQQGLETGLGESKFIDANKWYDRGLFLFRKAELNNRIATGMGAYKRARKEGMPHEQAIQEGVKANDFVNFDYSVANAPELLRNSGPIGPVVGQFKKYLVGLGTYMGKINKEVGHGKAATRFWMPYFAVSGLYGIPGLEAIKNMIAGLYDIDFEIEARNYINHLNGDEKDKELQKLGFPSGTNRQMAKILGYGLLSPISGIDISRRTGAGDIIPKDWMSLFGPLPSTLKRGGETLNNALSNSYQDWKATGNVFSGLQRDNMKDWSEFVRAIASSPGNIMKSALVKDGQLTNPMDRGRLVMEGMTNADRVKMALGFRPSKMAEEGDLARLPSYHKEQRRTKATKYLNTIVRNMMKDQVPTNQYMEDALNAGVTSDMINNEILQRQLPRQLRKVMQMGKKNWPSFVEKYGIDSLF